MRIAAVLDLLNRTVVRGVAGDRASYRPIESGLTSETTPIGVVDALRQALSLDLFYLADLDAIGGGEPNWEAYRDVLQRVGELWIDAGMANATAARRLAEFSADGRDVSQIVVGLESLTSSEDLRAICEEIGYERAVFSLDLKQGRPLTTIESWRNRPPMAIAEQALGAGYRRMIVLDLAAVGTGQGLLAADLCRRIKEDHPDVELASGGGVRHLEDLRRLADAGCDVALVASALHDGSLTATDLQDAAEF